jgi:hypothetical protein
VECEGELWNERIDQTSLGLMVALWESTAREVLA